MLAMFRSALHTASTATRPAARLPVYLVASVVLSAVFAAIVVSQATAQPSEPADHLELYDANDNGVIDRVVRPAGAGARRECRHSNGAGRHRRHRCGRRGSPNSGLEQMFIREVLRTNAHDRRAENELSGVDVTFNRKYDSGNERFPVGKHNIPTWVRFNTCNDNDPGDYNPDEGYKVYTTALHEAGHALGLSDIPLDLFSLLYTYETSPPTTPDSVMNYDDRAPGWVPSPLNEPDCSPHPFDVMAIYVIYQNVQE